MEKLREWNLVHQTMILNYIVEKLLEIAGDF